MIGVVASVGWLVAAALSYVIARPLGGGRRYTSALAVGTLSGTVSSLICAAIAFSTLSTLPLATFATAALAGSICGLVVGYYRRTVVKSRPSRR